ncbi:hypothetical protein [Nostoc sp.]|uniref:hypothetical protein n=1 Tax=Nostoc sp. TaxID=1180 RepID=UPI002FF8AF48
MFNRSFHNLCMESMIVGATLLVSTSVDAEDRNLVTTETQTNIPTAIAQTPKIPAIDSDVTIPQTNKMSQVTSVSRANASKLLSIITKLKNQRKNQDFAFDYF